MFDIGFGELLVIGVLALVVLGPERLPRVARTAGLWLGKARSMLANVKAEIDRELKAEELKRVLEQQAKAASLYEVVEETKAAVTDAANELKDSVRVAAAPHDVATQDATGKAPTKLPDDHG